LATWTQKDQEQDQDQEQEWKASYLVICRRGRNFCAMPFHRRRADGFTLVELAIAVVILVVLMMLAVPSMNGVLADQRLHRSLDVFNAMVREAHERSIAERRSYLIVWYDGKVGLRAEGLARGEDPEPTVKLKVARNESLKISFPAALVEKPPAEWIFWPSGNCEPAVVKYSGRNGNWTASYSALTARAQIVAYVAK
jgi:prepilin-type N-terminal cleavage/methylation domain-containing protein